MKLTLYDAQSAHNYALRLFVLERGGLNIDVQHVDLTKYENRRAAYRRNVNPRGEVPALRVGDDFILTEIPAIFEYLDEVSATKNSLFGDTPLERAETRMWLRRMDLEIAQPVIAWYRNDPETIDFYKGNRIPIPEARVLGKVTINQALNLLDDQLEGKRLPVRGPLHSCRHTLLWAYQADADPGTMGGGPGEGECCNIFGSHGR